jgi:predicted Zn-ribbon and HTH transcriptional regulator
MWIIEKVVSKGAYNYAVVRDHPFSTKNGYVLEHRIVMENHIGRLLTKEEIVHHKDENKKNNSIENLQIMSASEHKEHHHPKGRTFVELKCPNCGVMFFKEKRNIYGKKEPKCSRTCNGQYSRKIQLGLM